MIATKNSSSNNIWESAARSIFESRKSRRTPRLAGFCRPSDPVRQSTTRGARSLDSMPTTSLAKPVLLVTAGASPERGGQETSIRECAFALNARGVTVTVASPYPLGDGRGRHPVPPARRGPAVAEGAQRRVHPRGRGPDRLLPEDPHRPHDGAGARRAHLHAPERRFRVPVPPQRPELRDALGAGAAPVRAPARHARGAA